MIKNPQDFQTEIRENMRGGNGSVFMTNFITPADLYDKGRMFGKIVLKPGCSIGYHVHEKDTELFYFLKGTALYSDNGIEKTVSAGDVTYTRAGEGHSVANNSDEDVEMIALIVYAE